MRHYQLKRFTICCLLAVLALTAYQPREAISAMHRGDPPELIIILSVPGLSFQELTDDSLSMTPNLKSLLDRSALAALNVRTPERGIEDVYLTINAGAPALAPAEARAYQVGERMSDARDRYTRYTGTEPLGSEIVVPEIGYLTTLNEAKTYHAQVGKLGDMLRDYKVRTAVFGNPEDGETSADYAPLMLMTSEGTIPAGDISRNILTDDPGSPYGRRTDTQYLLEQIKDHLQNTDDPTEVRGGSSVILAEYSDWYRLDQERRSYASAQWTAMKHHELRRLDDFVGQLAALTAAHDHAQLWIMSPQPHTRAARVKLHVTPFIWYEDGAAGLLTSPTTKRTGLISMHDLGPTLLAELSIDPGNGWTGFPIIRENNPNAHQWLLEDVHKMQSVYELRTNVVIPFVTYEVIVLLLSLLMVLLKKRKALRWMRLPLFSLLAAPLFILLLGFIPEFDPGTQFAVLFFAVTVASVWCALFSNETGMFMLAAANTVALLIDGLSGARLIQYSIMGYDPMIGARYYGIGNEYMGVLVGSAILAAALAMQMMRARNEKSELAAAAGMETSDGGMALPPRDRRNPARMPWRAAGFITGAVFLTITLYMAYPQGGTNAGGALTASAAFGIAWLRIFGSARLRHISLIRLAIIVGGLLAAGLLLLWALNQWLIDAGSTGGSHIGRAMDLLGSGRIDLIMGIIARKLQMNLNLIGVSSWGKVLLTSIFVMAVLLLKPRGVLRQWQETRPYWMNGFTAIIIGSIVALALNDSGIVAAGTMIIFAAAPILLLIAEQDAGTRIEGRPE